VPESAEQTEKLPNSKDDEPESTTNPLASDEDPSAAAQAPLIGANGERSAAADNSKYGSGADHQFVLDSRVRRFSPLVALLYFMASVVVFMLVEDFDFTTAVYFCTVTITTVGYGDVTPRTDAGMVIFVVYILLGLCLVGFGLGILCSSASSMWDSVEKMCRWGVVDKFIGLTARLLLVNVVLLASIITTGSVFLLVTDDFTGIEAVYVSVATLTTVGFGDIGIPSEPGARWFFIVYVFFSVLAATSLIAGCANLWLDHEQNSMLKATTERGVTLEMIQAMDLSGDGKIDRAEFLCFMLVKLNHCDEAKLDQLNSMFDAVDADGSGFLDAKDIQTKPGADPVNSG